MLSGSTGHGVPGNALLTVTSEGMCWRCWSKAKEAGDTVVGGGETAQLEEAEGAPEGDGLCAWY